MNPDRFFVYYTDNHGDRVYLRIASEFLTDWIYVEKQKTLFNTYTEAAYWMDRMSKLERNLGLEIGHE